MKMQALPIEVSIADDGRINLIQEDQLAENDPTIVITPEQVPQLITWLQEAQKKLNKSENDC